MSWKRLAGSPPFAWAALLAVVLLPGLMACQQLQDPAGSEVRVESKVEALNFASEQRLVDHWQKHAISGNEWGSPISKKQYLQQARYLFALGSNQKQVLTQSDGDSVHYRAETNEFGVLSPDRVIRTYFRPNDGQAYFERQRNR